MTIEEFLRQLLDLMLFENSGIQVEDDGERVSIDISLSEEESGILIGRHGETIAALRRLIHTVFLDELTDKRLSVNVNDYRDQREERIRELVERGIRKIGNSDRSYQLYRLNAAERFFAHNLIATDQMYQDYTSHSITDEDGQRVLIIEHRSADDWSADWSDDDE